MDGTGHGRARQRTAWDGLHAWRRGPAPRAALKQSAALGAPRPPAWSRLRALPGSSGMRAACAAPPPRLLSQIPPPARCRSPARPVVGRWGASGASGGPCCIAALPVVLRGRSGLAAGFAARPSRRLRGSPPPPLPHPQAAAQGSSRAAAMPLPLRCARGRGVPCLSGAERLPWRGPPPPLSAAAPPQAGARKAAQGRCPCRGLSWGRNAPPLAWGAPQPSRNTSAAVPCWGPPLPPSRPPSPPVGARGEARG